LLNHGRLAIPDRDGILVIHDGDPIGRAIVSQLDGWPSLQARSDAQSSDLHLAASECRAIIAVGDRVAASAALLSVALNPGIRSLVLLVHRARDFVALRNCGVRYAVLVVAPLIEDLIVALSPALRSGSLILDRAMDSPVQAIAAEDAARCAIAAIDDDDCRGRIIELAAPQAVALSELAQRAAFAMHRPLQVRKWPHWLIQGMRVIKRQPFTLPAELAAQAHQDPPADVSQLHPGAWFSVEHVAATEAANLGGGRCR
jgi:hypothetical protein